MKAIYLADVVLFMIEADKEFTKTDKQICRLVLDKGKGLIFVINKIYLVDELKKIKNEYIFANPYTFDSIPAAFMYLSAGPLIDLSPINGLTATTFC